MKPTVPVIFLHYFAATLIPVAVFLGWGVLTVREDCTQCPVLFVVFGAMMLLFVAILNLSYFLLLIRVPVRWQLLQVLLATGFPSFVFSGFMVVNYFDPDGKNTDFSFVLPAMLALLACNLFACRKFSK